MDTNTYSKKAQVATAATRSAHSMLAWCKDGQSSKLT